MGQYFVYIMASRSRTLYVGVTNDLARRVAEHRSGAAPAFTARYRIHRLVYCAEFESIRQAIAAERTIKKWRREKKIELISAMNPSWKDLSEGWYADGMQEGEPRPREGTADPSLRSG